MYRVTFFAWGKQYDTIPFATIAEAENAEAEVLELLGDAVAWTAVAKMK